jgi:hypothetical protein
MNIALAMAAALGAYGLMPAASPSVRQNRARTHSIVSVSNRQPDLISGAPASLRIGAASGMLAANRTRTSQESTYMTSGALAASTPPPTMASGAPPTSPSILAPGFAAPADDPFYQPPPGYKLTKPGKVLRSRTLTLSPAYRAVWSSSGGYQLFYRTTDANGSPTATVATVLVPTHPAPGPRNLVSDQIAEDSLTTSCAPSHLLRQSPPPSSVPDKVMIGTALADGWDVVVSDYEGPDSELLVGPLEGRETLDGIRAAEEFAGDGLSGPASEVGLEGYSGGSVPTIWAGSLAASYAPKLQVVGVAAGGIAANLNYVTAHIDHSLLFGGVILGLIGISRAYPEMQPTDILDARGLQVAALDARDGYGCGGGVTAAVDGTAAQYTNFSTSQALAKFPALVKITDKLNAVQAPAPHAPVYLYNTVHDEIMRIEQVDPLYTAYCKAGTRVLYDRSSVGEHISGITAFGLRAPLYLAARFAGRSPPSTCTSHPNDPKQ